jgi:hypothetical protein
MTTCFFLLNDIGGSGGYINMPEELKLDSMDDVSALMRANLPKEMTPKEFGDFMQWGRGSASARARMATLTAEQLRQAGITAEMADNWAVAYEAVVRLTTKNPSAAGRMDLMRLAARLLRGE